MFTGTTSTIRDLILPNEEGDFCFVVEYRHKKLYNRDCKVAGVYGVNLRPLFVKLYQTQRVISVSFVENHLSE